MITCDQVVSGGSTERTIKMAAAPAADSIYSLSGSSTLFSYFFLSLVKLSFFLFVFLSPFSNYSIFCYSLFCSSNSPPDLSFRSFPPLSRLALCSERRLRCRRMRSGARWTMLFGINWCWCPQTFHQLFITNVWWQKWPVASNWVERITDRPSNPPQINHRQRRASSLATTPFRNLTSLHFVISSDCTLSTAANWRDHGFIRARTSLRNWHSALVRAGTTVRPLRPSARGSGHSAPLTVHISLSLSLSFSRRLSRIPCVYPRPPRGAIEGRPVNESLSARATPTRTRLKTSYCAKLPFCSSPLLLHRLFLTIPLVLSLSSSFSP